MPHPLRSLLPITFLICYSLYVPIELTFLLTVDGNKQNSSYYKFPHISTRRVCATTTYICLHHIWVSMSFRVKTKVPGNFHQCIHWSPTILWIEDTICFMCPHYLSTFVPSSIKVQSSLKPITVSLDLPVYNCSQ